jgi:hypothetical protein
MRPNFQVGQDISFGSFQNEFASISQSPGYPDIVCQGRAADAPQMTRYLGWIRPQQISDRFKARGPSTQGRDRIHDRFFVGRYIQCKLIADFPSRPWKVSTARSHHNHRSISNKSTSIALVHLYSYRLPFVDGQPSERTRTSKFNKVGDERNDPVFRRLRTSLSKRRHAGRPIRDARV